MLLFIGWLGWFLAVIARAISSWFLSFIPQAHGLAILRSSEAEGHPVLSVPLLVDAHVKSPVRAAPPWIGRGRVGRGQVQIIDPISPWVDVSPDLLCQTASINAVGPVVSTITGTVRPVPSIT